MFYNLTGILSNVIKFGKTGINMFVGSVEPTNDIGQNKDVYFGPTSIRYKRNNIWDTVDPVFVGASTVNGVAGVIPAPSTSNIEHYLKGDGSWNLGNWGYSKIINRPGNITLNNSHFGTLILTDTNLTLAVASSQNIGKLLCIKNVASTVVVLSCSSLINGFSTLILDPGSSVLLYVETSTTWSTLNYITTAYFNDTKITNTNGGSFTSGAWRTRDLNTTTQNSIVGCSLSSNTITIPKGQYIFDINCPCFNVGLVRLRLQDITNNITYAVSNNLYTTNATNGVSTINEVIYIPNTINCQLQHWCTSSKNTNGFGQATNISGLSEIYSTVRLIKLR